MDGKRLLSLLRIVCVVRYIGIANWLQRPDRITSGPKILFERVRCLWAHLETRVKFNFYTHPNPAHTLVILYNQLFSPLPSLSSDRAPCSNHSSRDIQKSSRFFMMSARTAPPRKTMCFRRGGSSMRILKFWRRSRVS